jgi:hypothetical protein
VVHSHSYFIYNESGTAPIFVGNYTADLSIDVVEARLRNSHHTTRKGHSTLEVRDIPIGNQMPCIKFNSAIIHTVERYEKIPA